MRLIAAPLAASVVLLLMLNVPGAVAQDSNLMKIETDLSITGLSSLSGSGTVKISFAGDPAHDVRVSIINAYDTGNQILNADELREFLQALSDALIGRPYFGMRIESATNFSGK